MLFDCPSDTKHRPQFMIHSILTLSTMVAVVLHALLGCCVHHEHACDSHAAPMVAHASDHGHHNHHHDSDNSCSDESESSEEHAPHPPCEEVECSFISSARDLDVSLLFSVTTWVPAIDYAAAHDAQASLTYRDYGTDPPDLFFGNLPQRPMTQNWRL